MKYKAYRLTRLVVINLVAAGLGTFVLFLLSNLFGVGEIASMDGFFLTWKAVFVVVMVIDFFYWAFKNMEW